MSSGFEVESFERLAELADAGADVVETAKRDIYAEVTTLVEQLEKSGSTDGVNLEDVERQLLTQALERANGNQSQAAQLLGINRDQVRYRIEKFGLKTT